MCENILIITEWLQNARKETKWDCGRTGKMKSTQWLGLLHTRSDPSSPSAQAEERITHKTAKAKHNCHQACEITLIPILTDSVLYAFFPGDISQCYQIQFLKNTFLAVNSLERTLCILEKPTQANVHPLQQEAQRHSSDSGAFQSISL